MTSDADAAKSGSIRSTSFLCTSMGVASNPQRARLITEQLRQTCLSLGYNSISWSFVRLLKGTGADWNGLWFRHLSFFGRRRTSESNHLYPLENTCFEARRHIH